MRLEIVRVSIMVVFACLAASACVPIGDTIAGGGANDPHSDNPALDRVDHTPAHR